MKRIALTLFAAASLFGASSCACYGPGYAGPNTRAGAAAGGLTGAGIGGIIGHQSGRGLEGAAIGGALGMLAGALFGSAADDAYYGPRGYYDGPYYDGPPGPPPPGYYRY